MQGLGSLVMDKQTGDISHHPPRLGTILKRCCHGSPGNHRPLLSGSQNLGGDESARELPYEALRES